MGAWAERHRNALEAVLEPGEVLRDADRVIAARRRTARAVPRTGFVLTVTDRRIVALRASVFLARPCEVVASWRYDEGAALAPAPLRRLRLVLPDRSVVTLRSFGLHSIRHLGRS